MSERTGPSWWTVARAFAETDSRVLWRMKTPVIFMFAVPALLCLMLGPAVSGDSDAHAGRSVIGFAVLFSFMTINYVGLALFREHGENTWTRQAVYRTPTTAYLAGKLGPVAVIGLAQLVLFAVVTFAVYDLPLNGDVAQLFAVAVPLALCGPLMGVILYNITKSRSSFQSITYVVLLGMGGAGGTIVTPERLPELVHTVGMFTPHHWAMSAFAESTIGSGSWQATAVSAGIICAMLAVFSAVAFATFDSRVEKKVLA